MARTGKVPAVLSMALGLIMFAPSTVQAQGQQSADPAAMYKSVGADETQLNQIRAAAKQFEEESRARAQQMMTLMKDMRSMSLQPDPDEASVLSKQTDINKVSSEQAMARTKLLLQVRKILKPEQKQKLVQMLQQGGNGGGAAPGTTAGSAGASGGGGQ